MSQAPSHPLLAATLDVAMFSLRRVRPHVVAEAAGEVLELGVGTGLNLPHYGRDAVKRLVGVEPDPNMARRARRRAEGLGAPLELHEVSAEALPFPDASFDVVVATFVLCTIPDVPAALAEARRVLRPGGRLLFAEHVRSEAALVARVQDGIDGVWGCFSGGCHLNRDSGRSIVEAGFVDVVTRPHGATPWALLPVISGSASSHR